MTLICYVLAWVLLFDSRLVSTSIPALSNATRRRRASATSIEQPSTNIGIHQQRLAGVNNFITRKRLLFSGACRIAAASASIVTYISFHKSQWRTIKYVFVSSQGVARRFVASSMTKWCAVVTSTRTAGGGASSGSRWTARLPS